MAKRELIDKEYILNKFNKTYFDNKTVIRCAELVCNGAPTITEEEIVKPYLEKLSKEISEAYEDDEYDGYDPNALGRFEERVQELIDNLLAEKGTEE